MVAMNKFYFIALILSLVFSEAFTQGVNDSPIRGIWITNVGSSVLKSRSSIQKSVRQCRENGFNNIYVVVWNDGLTLYPSDVLQKYIGIKQDSTYAGRDPLQEIVEDGHKAGLKVHAWFEFGFSYSYKDSNSIWFKRYPQWVGRDAKGAILKKNDFYWWSSIRPDVQEFMTSLIMEVVSKYDVDGIQGDDRLPAMPAEGGYDDYTVELYRSAHKGAMPPKNWKDSSWVDWRAQQLSKFGQHIYKSVKSLKPHCVVSWAPSPFPWSKEEYLQDWPAWLKGGYADYIIPQLYRYDMPAYKKVLMNLNDHLDKKFKPIVFPGMLTSLGNGYQSSLDFTRKMIQLNRQLGFQGEVLFYFETLNRLKGSIYNK